jgi:hypothetical protein
MRRWRSEDEKGVTFMDISTTYLECHRHFKKHEFFFVLRTHKQHKQHSFFFLVFWFVLVFLFSNVSANKLVSRWKHIVGYYVLLYDKLKKSSILYIYIYIHSLLVSGQSSMIQIVKPNVPPFADIIHPSPFKFKFFILF